MSGYTLKMSATGLALSIIPALVIVENWDFVSAASVSFALLLVVALFSWMQEND